MEPATNNNKNPKLGKPRSNTVTEMVAEKDAQADDPESKEYGIKVWNLITANPKKVEKLKKSRKMIYLCQSMAVKLNNLDSMRLYFEKLSLQEKEFANNSEAAFTLINKVYRIFIHMLIYVMNLYMESEIEHALTKSKKKLEKDCVSAVLQVHEYVEGQLRTLQSHCKVNIFKRVLLRVWKVMQEDMAELVNDDTKPAPTPTQICVLEDLLDTVSLNG